MSHNSKQGFTLLQFVFVLAILVGMAIILVPVFGRRNFGDHGPSCQSNLKQILLAMKQYTQDNGEKYPMVQQGSNPADGWSTAISRYLKSTQVFQCPSEPTSSNSDPAAIGYCDYFYSSSLGPRQGGKSEAALDDSATTIIMGDGALFSSGSASNGGTISQPGPPSINGASTGLAMAQGQWDPAVSGSRTLDGGNYGFADGHVKWLLPKKVTRNPTSFNNPTFRLTAKNPPTSGS